MTALDLIILLLFFGGLNAIFGWFLKYNNRYQRLFHPGTLVGATVFYR